MTPCEIYNELINKRIINRYSKDPLWVKAFEMFNSTNQRKLQMTCPSCYDKVKQWLKSQC